MGYKVLTLHRQFFTTQNQILKRFLYGMAWSLLGTIISKGLMMVALVITARILGVTQYGEYSMINSTILMFSTFAGLGLGTTATRFVAEYKYYDKQKCGRIIGLTNTIGFLSGCFMTVVLFYFSPYLASKQLNATHLESVLKLSSFLLLINTINTIQNSVLSGFEDFKGIARISVIQGIIIFPIYIFFTYLYQIKGLVLGNIFVGCIMLILFAIQNYKMRKVHGIRIDLLGGITTEIKIVWQFSFPSLLSNVMVGPVTWVGNTIIAFTENGYYQLGIYNAADQWRHILLFLPSVVGNVILPLIVANKGNIYLERINILFGWVIVNCVAIPVLALPELITILYGSEFSGQTLNSSLLIVILICSIVSYKQGIARNLISNNLMWWGFLDNTLWGVVFLGLLYGIREWGAIGISVSYLIAYIVTTVIFIPFYIKRKVVIKSLIVSKEIIFMWVALFMQTTTTAITGNIAVRVISLAISILAFCRVINLMLKTPN